MNDKINFDDLSDFAIDFKATARYNNISSDGEGQPERKGGTNKAFIVMLLYVFPAYNFFV